MAFSFLPFVALCGTVVALYCLFIKSRRSKRSSFPLDWPILGVLPSLIPNLHNLNEYALRVLGTSCGSLQAHGPLLSSMRFFATCDPTNIRHIFTVNHANYPKGEEFGEIFDIMRDSLLTADGESARRQRGKYQSILSNPRMVSLMSSYCKEKVTKALIPCLDIMANTRAPFDLHDLLTRFTFDLSVMPIFSVDPGLLSPDELRPAHAAAAMNTVMAVGLLRHAMPASCWKLMRWLNIGPEKKLAAAQSTLHQFIMEMMEKRRAENVDNKVDILSSYIHDPAESSDDDLRHATPTLLTYILAGRDTMGATLPWFFYNLAKNPHVISAIRKELEPIVSRKHASMVASNNYTSSTKMVVFEPEDTKGLLYLQAALFESLRLHPPIPIERKTVLEDDVMPSGHEVRSGDTVLISLYALGRMESVWGKDCHDYKPERWLSEAEDGLKLRYFPSHKFLVFNSGPRMCLGKDIAVTQLKTVAAAVVWNFDMQVLEGQNIQPKLSCILQMKSGLMVVARKRE